MLRQLGLIALTGSLASGPAAAGFLACQVRDCARPAVVQVDCSSGILFIQRIDPICEARNSALRAQAEAEYEACLQQQKLDRANCAALEATRNLEQSIGGIDPGEEFKTNGVACISSSECESGFCLPGPGRARSLSAIPEKSDVTWYCASEKANCALPDDDGGLYGDSIDVNGTKLVCQNPGRGLWGQFYPPE
jgi:hypothetical protein